MNLQRNVIAVAMMATATMLAGCSTAVTGAPVTAPAPPKAAIETTAASVPGPVGQLVDVTGQVQFTGRTSNPGGRWALSPEPGINVSTTAGGCTLGPAITRAGQSGFLVADHCRKGGLPQLAKVRADSATLDIGVAETVAEVPDVAVIWTGTAADDSRIAGQWPVRGALSAAQSQSLATGAVVCVNAAISGVTCGTITSVSPTAAYMLLPAQRGDSGSQVFAVDARGDAWLVGVLTDGARGDLSVATLLAPALKQLGATAVTA